MIRTAHNPFSTLRLFDLSAGADPGGEPTLRHAGVLIGPDGAVTSWDGVTGPVTERALFLTTTGNDLTGPELKALANRLNGLPLPIGLTEPSRARVTQLYGEATGLLEQVRPWCAGPDAPGGPE